MALDRDKLYDGLVDAFTKGQEVETVEEDDDGNVIEEAAKYSDADVAGFIAKAFEAYALDAKIKVSTMLPPALMPGVPPVVSVPAADQAAHPDMSVFAPSGTLLGTAALEAGLAGLFAGGVPGMPWGPFITAFAAASFAMWGDTGVPPAPNSAAGGCVLVPPVLISAQKIGDDGGEMEEVAGEIADLCHLAFTTAIFSGAGTTYAGIFAPGVVLSVLS